MITWEESSNAFLFKKADPPFSIQMRPVGSHGKWTEFKDISVGEERSCIVASQDADTYEFRMIGHFVDRSSSGTMAERLQRKLIDFCNVRETEAAKLSNSVTYSPHHSDASYCRKKTTSNVTRFFCQSYLHY